MKRVSAAEAGALVQEQGYLYVDVRSVPEFELTHPEGAYNVPLVHAGSFGMAPNPDFLKVMERRFPRNARLLVGCASGSRSLEAARMLESAGWTDVVELRPGFEGRFDIATFRREPGWRAAGLPVGTGNPPERSWDALSRDAP